MEIVRSHRKSSVGGPVPVLSFYRSAPPLEVRLEDFELFAMDRLRGKRAVEREHAASRFYGNY
ncbi:putative DNA primase large subunit [Nymphaea thermarum]|nr:putative DNA primase large subunit [Nymphaea thermarum]